MAASARMIFRILGLRGLRLQKFYTVQTVGPDALFRLHFRNVADKDSLSPLAARVEIADVVLSRFVRPRDNRCGNRVPDPEPRTNRSGPDVRLAITPTKLFYALI